LKEINNRSKKMRENLEEYLRREKPLRVLRSRRVGESNPLEIEGVRWRRPQITLGEPSRRTNSSWDGKRRLGFQWVLGPLYIPWKPETWTYSVGRACPMKTASTVLETLETSQKLDIQQILA
jgi:hypothetical protein